VKPRWRTYDHEHAIKGRNFQADNSQLLGALRRGEHHPPVSIADDNSGSANALYDTIEQTVVFFKMAFGHDPDLEKNYLMASYYYGMSVIGGRWKPNKRQAVFSDGTSVFNNAVHRSDL
jgi:hypothetical protein